MRIASLTCSNTEIVCALGLGDQLMALDDHSDYPKAIVEKVPRLGPDLSIDVDVLEKLNPDIVLASLTVPGHEKVVEEIAARGMPYIAPDPQSLSDIFRDVIDIAQLLDVPERGEALVGWMKKGLQEKKTESDHPPILVEWWPRPVYVPGHRSWVNEMLELAGAVNPWHEYPAHSLEVSQQQAVEKDPAAVVISWCGIDPSRYQRSRVLSRPGWQQISAIRHQHVFCIPEAYLGRPGPRLVEGVRRLRAVVETLASQQ